MKRLSTSVTFLFALFLVSCAASEPEARTDIEMDVVAVEVIVNDDDLSFWDVPYIEEPIIDTTPTDRKDGIEVGELGVDGGNKDLIVTLAQEIGEGQHGNYDSLLITHKDKLIFESYYLGGRVNMTHPQVSATKAYTGLALGRAIQLGYLTLADLDKPLVSFLTDLDSTKFVDGAELITLHQALTMRSGIRINEDQKKELEKDPALLKGQGHVQATLELSSPITPESQSYKYQGDPMLVMQVIDAVVPGTAEDFIRSELFDKMGIRTYGWQRDVSGLPFAGVRASITSRAMVKLGTLAMNDGKWNGEQLVPQAFIAKSINRVIRLDNEDIFGGGEDISDPGYGYYWWQADMKLGDKSYFSTSAQGGGGQFIILIAELDLIIVATAHEGDVKTLQTTAERILPAFAG